METLLDRLNDRQRDTLIEICREYEQTGKPVSEDRAYNAHYTQSFSKYGQPPPGGNEIDDLLDHLKNRHLVEQTRHSITPTDELLQHLRQAGLL